MNLKIFAQMYLEDAEMFEKSSVYEGLIGESVMQLVKTFRKQQHSGNSSDITVKVFLNVVGAYRNPDHPIWKKWEQSEEGQKFLKENGISPAKVNNPDSTPTEPEVRILIPNQGIIQP